ncbi:MAG: PilC/PilY family type IV pilus protein [Wenzhouxiangellaceae bacterium]
MNTRKIASSSPPTVYQRLVCNTQFAVLVALLGFAGGYSAPSQAMPLNIPNLPLFVGVDIQPNVFLEIDDSGSMDWEVLTSEHFMYCSYIPSPDNGAVCPNFVQSDTMVFPRLNNFTLRGWVYYSDTNDNTLNESCQDFQGGGQNNSVRRCLANGYNPIVDEWRFYSSDHNLMFFNPNVDYQPWVGFGDASFSAARSNPQSGTPGYTNFADLDGFEFAVWIDDRGFNGPFPDPVSADMTNTGNERVDLWDSHVRVRVNNGNLQCWQVNYTTAAFRPTRQQTGMTNAACAAFINNQSLAELQQNIANWYQYSRRRSLVTRGAVVQLLEEVPNLRYGLSLINEFNQLFVEMPPASADAQDILDHNEDLVEDFLDHDWQNFGTPLRNGLRRVGDYFDAASNPLDQGRTSPIIEACQKNFSVVFTDGFWNGGDPGVGDVDGDGIPNLLADVAMEYYNRDLDTSLDDIVPVDAFDPNTAQHLVTYTIAFGLEGALVDNDDDGWPDPPLARNSNVWWNAGGGGNTSRVDDLWHSAFNARGEFISASRPEQVASALLDTLQNIVDRTGTAASAATNGGSITTESRVYQAVFNSEDWSGQLFSFRVQNDGSLASTPEWDAGALLDARPNSYFSGTRKIYTMDPVSNNAYEFFWGNLTPAQQAMLDLEPDSGVPDGLGEKRVNMIRGVDVNDPDIRETDKKLGDLINSDPEFVSAPRFFFNFDDYQTFFNDNKSRRSMVYIGGNDGMLHAFDAITGEERFNYIPAAVIPRLNQLTDPVYSHRFFVDGSPSYGDVQMGGNWRSVLAGGLRSGGQAVYALDITDPDSFSAGNVLWEFSDADDPDLGYTFARPTIVKMNNDKWAVVFGNGYNNTEADGNVSSDGDAVLFILFIEDGTDGFQSGDFVKIKTNSGTLTDPNGLGPVGVADVDGDSVADALYAGDLQGNLWKFDVSGASPASWNVSFSGDPLFIAKTGGGLEQPITSAPTAIAHPLGIGQGGLVLFGTGKFIEGTDANPATTPDQTFYAVWDRDLSMVVSDSTHGFDRGALAEIKLTGSGGQRFFDETGSQVPEWLNSSGVPEDRGWYVDLPDQGERIVRPALVRSGVVFFVTLIPSDEPCIPGGTGFLMALDTATGGVPTPEQLGSPTVFDTNGDGVFDEFDNPGDEVVIGIEQGGIPALPAVIFDPRPLCEREPSNPACDSDGDGTPDVGTTDAFPPPLNDLRGCGSEGTRIYLYTTTSNGDITQATAGLSNISCGRQGWRQRR